MIDLVIPYKESTWKYELVYALRSWDMHFKEDFQVTIYGYKPDWLVGVNYIPDFPPNPIKLHDVGLLNQRRRAHWLINFDRPFLWSNDDMYLVKDMTIDDFNKLYYREDVSGVSMPDEYIRPWRKRFWNTIFRCRDYGFTNYNGETHLPIYYDNDILIKTFDLFSDIKAEDGGWITKTAYINTYLSLKPDAELIHCNTIKNGLYRKYDMMNITPTTKILNHDDRGLTVEIKEFLQDTFKKPSRFEKRC